MKIKLTLMVLLIIASTSGCVKNIDQNSNNNLSTKIQELGDRLNNYTQKDYPYMKNDNLKLGDIIKINSPIRLKDIHLHKGYICGRSYDDDENIAAYAVSVHGKCYTVLIGEIENTGEYINPAFGMTDTHIKISVDQDGKGRLVDESYEGEEDL